MHTFLLTLSLTIWIGKVKGLLAGRDLDWLTFWYGKVKGLQAGRDLDWKPATVATIIIALKIMQ